MKKLNTLKRQNKILLTVVVLLQSIILLLSLYFSGIYNLLNYEAFRVFESVSESKLNSCNKAIKNIVKSTSSMADYLNQEILDRLEDKNISPEMLYMYDDVFKNISNGSAKAIIDFLDNNDMSGAFVVFKGSNLNKEQINSHSAIYIRSITQGKNFGKKTYELEIGKTDIGEKRDVYTAANWEIDWNFDINADDSSAYDFYSKPQAAAQVKKKLMTEQYGYFANPSDILNDGIDVITYSVPLIDKRGVFYGVFGVEMNSAANWFETYFDSNEMSYRNSFSILTKATKQKEISLEWYLMDTPIYNPPVQTATLFPLKKVPGTNLYETRFPSLGDMYCSNEKLKMYGKNAMFADEAWEITTCVPKDQISEGSQRIGNILIFIIIISTLIAIVVIDIIVKLTSKKIEDVSKSIEDLEPFQELKLTRTNLKEIDDLITAVENFSRDIINTFNNVSNIFDMTALPIGAYEIRDDIGQVIVTNFIRELLNIRHNGNILSQTFKGYHRILVSNPLPDTANTYEYIDSKTGVKKYLKIFENDSETGKIGVIIDVSKEIEEKQKLAYEVEHDFLTGIYNRNAFRNKVTSIIESRPDKVGVMIFADLDNLKYVNDTFGHECGDKLIRETANMLSSFNKYDAVVSRISGDEFAVYMHGLDSKKEYREIIKNEISRHYSAVLNLGDDRQVRIRASKGISWYPDDARTTDDLIKLADYAMYEVKHNNKGNIIEFNRESYDKNVYLLNNRDSINLLIENSLILFHYQPIVDLKTGEIFAYEMLMRSEMAEFRSPLEILEVAKSQSKLGQLERVILFKAFAGIKENEEKLSGKKIFVNSIPSQVISAADLAELKEKYQDLFNMVVVEMIEQEIDSAAQLDKKVNLLKKEGLLIAIDDFGNGYSNEIRILNVNPDVVKIDMELVQGIHSNEDKQALVKNLISYCKNKNVKIVAEGVEVAEDLKTVKDMGVDFLQGYYAARPAAEILDLPEQKKREIAEL